MQNALENIRWKTHCPWLLLVDCLRVAFRVRVLLLAFFAVLLVFAVASLVNLSPTTPFLFSTKGEIALETRSPAIEISTYGFGKRTAFDLLLPWRHLAAPILDIISRPWAFTKLTISLLFFLWQVAIWAVFGGVICRIAALALTRGEAPDLPHALKFAKHNYGAFVAAPMMVLIGVLLTVLPLGIAGLLMRAEWLSFVAAIFWPLALMIGLIAALLGIGLALGFPLMGAAIAVEETDAFDAISRAFAYIYQRPLKLLWYVIVAALLGWLGGMAVELVVTATRAVSDGAVAWGLGENKLPPTASKIIQFWTAGLSVFRTAYYYAYFWSVAVGIYLLLRRDIDSVQLDEVTVEPPETYTPSPLVAAGTPPEIQPASS